MPPNLGIEMGANPDGGLREKKKRRKDREDEAVRLEEEKANR